MTILRNCPVTHSDAEVNKPYVKEKHSAEFKQHGLHTGIDIAGNEAVSICDGVVKRVTDKSVFVYDGKCGFLYDNLDEIYVDESEEIEANDPIGSAKNYVHFEYMTKQGEKFPFRYGNITLFRQDPTNILETGYTRDVTFDRDDVYNDVLTIADTTQPDYTTPEEYYDVTDEGDGFFLDE